MYCLNTALWAVGQRIPMRAKIPKTYFFIDPGDTDTFLHGTLLLYRSYNTLYASLCALDCHSSKHLSTPREIAEDILTQDIFTPHLFANNKSTLELTRAFNIAIRKYLVDDKNAQVVFNSYLLH